jgi:hypothetical protein
MGAQLELKRRDSRNDLIRQLVISVTRGHSSFCRRHEPKKFRGSGGRKDVGAHTQAKSWIAMEVLLARSLVRDERVDSYPQFVSAGP